MKLKLGVIALVSAALLAPGVAQGHQVFDGHDGGERGKTRLDIKQSSSGWHKQNPNIGSFSRRFAWVVRTKENIPTRLMQTRGAFGAFFWKSGVGDRPYAAIMFHNGWKWRVQVIRYRKNGSFYNVASGRAARNGRRDEIWFDIKRDTVGLGGDVFIYYRTFSIHCENLFCSGGGSYIDIAPNDRPAGHNLQPQWLTSTSSQAAMSADDLVEPSKGQLRSAYRKVARSG